jgi:hypothetical protein
LRLELLELRVKVLTVFLNDAHSLPHAIHLALQPALLRQLIKVHRAAAKQGQCVFEVTITGSPEKLHRHKGANFAQDRSPDFRHISKHVLTVHLQQDIADLHRALAHGRPALHKLLYDSFVWALWKRLEDHAHTGFAGILRCSSHRSGTLRSSLHHANRAGRSLQATQRHVSPSVRRSLVRLLLLALLRPQKILLLPGILECCICLRGRLHARILCLGHPVLHPARPAGMLSNDPVSCGRFRVV